MASAADRLPVAPSAPAYAWYVALLLATAHLVSFIDRYLMSLMMEPLKADLGVSDTQLGLLQGTGFVVLYTILLIVEMKLMLKAIRKGPDEEAASAPGVASPLIGATAALRSAPKISTE